MLSVRRVGVARDQAASENHLMLVLPQSIHVALCVCAPYVDSWMGLADLGFGVCVRALDILGLVHAYSTSLSFHAYPHVTAPIQR